MGGGGDDVLVSRGKGMNLCRVESPMNTLYQVSDKCSYTCTVLIEEPYVVPIVKQIQDGC